MIINYDYKCLNYKKKYRIFLNIYIDNNIGFACE